MTSPRNSRYVHDCSHCKVHATVASGKWHSGKDDKSKELKVSVVISLCVEDIVACNPNRAQKCEAYEPYEPYSEVSTWCALVLVACAKDEHCLYAVVVLLRAPC